MSTQSSIAERIETPGPRTNAARPGVWLADAALLLMSLIWGVNYSVIKYGTSVVPPLAYNATRVVLAALSLLVVAAVFGGARPTRRDAWVLFALGMLGNGVYQLFFIEGVARTRAGEAALVVGASPAMIAMFGRLFGIERVTRRGIVGIVLSMLGVGLIVLGRATSGGSAQGGSLTGDLLVLAGAGCWAIYTVRLSPFTRRLDPWWLAAYTMLGGAAVIAIAGARTTLSMSWSTVPHGAYWAMLYSSLGALVIAYMFWYYGVRV
ncbi:MAG TPA: EamA family transporter, partial [Gemmatimonadaceae bacterium]|nr:EamA family transporter [Gemmatimonadaceae bacterium]